MIIAIVHSLLSFVLPFGCGLAIGMLFQTLAGTLLRHLVGCLLASMASIVTGYVAFLIFSAVMTGSWPSEISVGGLAYALAWFSIVSVCTSVPASLSGYVCAVVLARRPMHC